jgi:hypothetical protein
MKKWVLRLFLIFLVVGKKGVQGEVRREEGMT